MQGSPATEGHHREVTWIVPSFHRNYADRFGHRGLNHLQNAGCEILHGRNGAFCFFHPEHHALTIQLHGSAKEALRIQPPQREVRVGYSWLLAAPKTDRSGYR